MKILFDFLPIALFFGMFKYAEGEREWAAAMGTEWLGFMVAGTMLQAIVYGLDEDGFLQESIAEIRASLSYPPFPAGGAEPVAEQDLLGEGKKIYGSCESCHGADGKGNVAMGAPNLTDNVWLHGWGADAIIKIVNEGKNNAMPAQKDKLNEAQIHVLASYVWSKSNPTAAATCGRGGGLTDHRLLIPPPLTRI